MGAAETAGRARRRHRWIIWAIVVPVLLVVAIVGLLLANLQALNGPVPPALTLPASPTAPPGAGAAALDGTWNAGDRSVAGYRLVEDVLGQRLTVAGRTTKVWGSIAVSGASVRTGSFTVAMADVMRGASQRKVMDVDAHPTATFSMTSPIELGAVPPEGAVQRFPVAGDLTMHGATRPVTFTVSAVRSADTISVLTEIPVVLADWGVFPPDSGVFGSAEKTGTVEVLLRLTRGPGNPATA